MLVAIIDIGSNSVRLVFYDYAKAYPQAIFNEKVTCTLGDGLAENGKLCESAKQQVRQTIRRFKALIEARKPELVEILATAAMRDAADGRAFADELSNIINHKIQILSGEQESIYAAYGVLATTWKPCGVVVDMGGGSTDISHIDELGRANSITSIPHGAIYFAQYSQKHGGKKLHEYLQKLLAPLKAFTVANIYPVGGSFRAIATHHMARAEYPLHIIHDYCLNTTQLKQLRHNIEADFATNTALVDVPKRRQNAILPALLCLQKIAEITGANQCVFSSAGIREGALAVAMNLHINPPDPLIAMMRSIHSILIDDAYVHHLCSIINDIIPIKTYEPRILLAFCYISEIAANMHPDYRAEYAFERIIAIQGFGLTHQQQAMLALASYYRYRSKLRLKHPALALLNEEMRNFAYVIGRLANISYSLSGGSATMLSCFNISFDANAQTLVINSQIECAAPLEMPEIHTQLNELIAIFNQK